MKAEASVRAKLWRLFYWGWAVLFYCTLSGLHGQTLNWSYEDWIIPFSSRFSPDIRFTDQSAVIKTDSALLIYALPDSPGSAPSLIQQIPLADAFVRFDAEDGQLATRDQHLLDHYSLVGEQWVFQQQYNLHDAPGADVLDFPFGINSLEITTRNFGVLARDGTPDTNKFVYLYEQAVPGGVFTYLQRIQHPASLGIDHWFGTEMEFSERHLAIRYHPKNTNGPVGDGIYLYERSGYGEAYTFLHHLQGPGAIDGFGESIVLQGDELFVGTTTDVINPPPGMLFHYKLNGLGWEPHQIFTGVTRDFARNVAVDGNRMLVSPDSYFERADASSPWVLHKKLLLEEEDELDGNLAGISDDTLMVIPGFNDRRLVGYHLDPGVRTFDYHRKKHVLLQGVPIWDQLPVTRGHENVVQFTIQPDLSPGLTLNPTTGILSGTPEDIAEATSYVVSALTDSGAVWDEQLDFAVVANGGLLFSPFGSNPHENWGAGIVLDLPHLAFTFGSISTGLAAFRQVPGAANQWESMGLYGASNFGVTSRFYQPRLYEDLLAVWNADGNLFEFQVAENTPEWRPRWSFGVPSSHFLTTEFNDRYLAIGDTRIDDGTVWLLDRSSPDVAWSLKATLNHPRGWSGTSFGQHIQLTDTDLFIAAPNENGPGATRSGVVYHALLSDLVGSNSNDQLQNIIPSSEAGRDRTHGELLRLDDDLLFVSQELQASLVFRRSPAGVWQFEQKIVHEAALADLEISGAWLGLAYKDAGYEVLQANPARTAWSHHKSYLGYVGSNSDVNSRIALDGDVLAIADRGNNYHGEGSGVVQIIDLLNEPDVFFYPSQTWVMQEAKPFAGPTPTYGSVYSAKDSFSSFAPLPNGLRVGARTGGVSGTPVDVWGIHETTLLYGNEYGSIHTNLQMVIYPEVVDWGDAPLAAQSGQPADYPTLLGAQGGAHFATGPFLGLARNATEDPAPVAHPAEGDLDDDGIRFPGRMLVSTNRAVEAFFDVYVSALGVGSHFLNGWIDFNQDGIWSGTEEQVCVDRVISNIGWTRCFFEVPRAPAGQPTNGVYYARFRFAQQSGLGPTGLAFDGEVEDHAMTYGIAPASDSSVEVSHYDLSDLTFCLSSGEEGQVAHVVNAMDVLEMWPPAPNPDFLRLPDDKVIVPVSSLSTFYFLGKTAGGLVQVQEVVLQNKVGEQLPSVGMRVSYLENHMRVQSQNLAPGRPHVIEFKTKLNDAGAWQVVRTSYPSLAGLLDELLPLPGNEGFLRIRSE